MILHILLDVKSASPLGLLRCFVTSILIDPFELRQREVKIATISESMPYDSLHILHENTRKEENICVLLSLYKKKKVTHVHMLRVENRMGKRQYRACMI